MKQRRQRLRYAGKIVDRKIHANALKILQKSKRFERF